MAKNRERYKKAYKAGLAFNKAGQYEKAFTAFRVAINEFPREAPAYAGLGEACLNLKQLDRALECYKLATRYSRGDLSYLQKVADIQERQGQLNEASRTYMAVGELLLKQQEIDEAVGNWERAIRLDPGLLGAHRRLAMTFQRQHRQKEAVREYLAIARILQMRGENKKAMQMCQAAMRLDPGNEDVLTAMELIRHGEAAFAQKEKEEQVTPTISTEEQEEADQLTQTVRQMAAAFEAERQQQPKRNTAVAMTPVEAARRLAQEQLAEEIFRDEDDETDSNASLSKLERDAALGQGMDFEQRGQTVEAIDSYKKAIENGLQLAAAYFTLGLLYLDNNQAEEARKMLTQAAQDPAYRKACQEALS